MSIQTELSRTGERSASGLLGVALFVSAVSHAALLSLDYRDLFAIGPLPAGGAMAPALQVLVERRTGSDIALSTAGTNGSPESERRGQEQVRPASVVEVPARSAGENLKDREASAQHAAGLTTVALAPEAQGRPRQPSVPAGRHNNTATGHGIRGTDSNQRRQGEEPQPAAPGGAQVRPVEDAQNARSQDGARKQREQDQVDGNARAEALAIVRSALARHFYYPKLARLRNLSGRVVLGFTLDSGGRVESVHVVSGSGHGILDRAAVKALAKAGTDRMRVAVSSGQTLELELPVLYRLQ